MKYSDITQLESIAGSSPFYIADRARFEANFQDLTQAFASRYQPFVLAYSYKTNYIPYLCGIVKQKGGWAEVVSRLEYDLAIKLGQNPEKIIFNGPVKTVDDIERSLDNGSIVNLDNQPEVDAAVAYAKRNPHQSIRIGLRVNISLSDEAGQSHIQNSLKAGRFGFSPDWLGSQSSKLNSQNIRVVSLHGHTSTTDRSLWCFEVIAGTLCRMAEKYFPDTIEYLNVGGGFFGRMHPDLPFKNAPGFDDYARTVCQVLNSNTWVRNRKPALVIEPGVAMAADCVSFVTRVVSVKIIAGQRFVTVDGSAFHCKPTFHSLNMPYRVITRQPHAGQSTYTVVGSTCMEKDVLLKDIAAPLPEPGDFIQIDNVGAYTLVMTPPFIHPAPAIVADEGSGSFRLIRNRQTLDDVFSNYIF